MMNDSPRVSIGLPVHNGDLFLEEAIESILSQTFTDFRLIIVDNASTDATSEIARQAARHDERVRYVRNTENIGAAANFNKAFRHATGPYFKWAAADDVCRPTFLDRCVELLDSDPDAVLAYPDPLFVNASGTPLPYSEKHRAYIDDNGKAWYWRMEHRHRLTSMNPIDRFDQILLRTYVCQEIFGLIRRDALEGTPLIDEYYGSDKVLLANLALKGRFRRVPEELFVRRCHRGQSGYKSARERETWITGHSRKITLAQWKVFRGYARSLAESSLSSLEKLRGAGVLYRYLARPEKIKRLVVPGPKNYLGIDLGRAERRLPSEAALDVPGESYAHTRGCRSISPQPADTAVPSPATEAHAASFQ